MAGQLLAPTVITAFDANGEPISGATMTFYTTGTTTLASIYTTSALNVAHSNPLTADGSGRFAAVYLNPQTTYRIILKDASGVTIKDVDPVNLPLDAAQFTYQDSGTSSVSRQLDDKIEEMARSALDFASSSLRTSIAARTSNDAVSAVATATNAVDLTTHVLKVPAGFYQGSGFDFPYDTTNDRRGAPLRIEGVGPGESFVDSASQKGAVFDGTDATRSTVRIKQRGANEGTGSVFFSGFRIQGEQNSGVFALDIDGLTGINSIREFVVYQAGDGGGVQATLLTTSKVEQFVCLNSDWNTAGTGITRTGYGFEYNQALDHGLAFIGHSTCRGFHTAYGIGTGTNRVLAAKLQQVECSYNTNGIVITSLCEGISLDTPYLEGVTGIGIDDSGESTVIVNPYSVLGSTTHMDLKGETSVVIGGQVGLDADSKTGIKASNVKGTVVLGTYTVRGSNGSSVGVQIGSMANPQGLVMPFYAFTGSSGSKTSDLSYSTEHGGNTDVNGAGAGETHGSGFRGIITRQANDGQDIPCLARGAINRYVDGTAKTQANVVSNVLDLGASSAIQLTCASAVDIQRFTSINLPDKTGMIYITNGNVTITPGTYIAGIANAEKFAAGEKAVIEYQVLPGADAQVLITKVHRVTPLSRTVATLPTGQAAGTRAIVTDANATTFMATVAGGGANIVPVFFDGTNWKIG